MVAMAANTRPAIEQARPSSSKEGEGMDHKDHSWGRLAGMALRKRELVFFKVYIPGGLAVTLWLHIHRYISSTNETYSVIKKKNDMKLRRGGSSVSEKSWGKCG